MAIVYNHKRKDNKEIFYIGIGKDIKRAHSKQMRNKYWQHIVDKYGYEVEITHQDIIWEEACSIEQYLISFYGRKDLGQGNLVNMTDGGEGNNGMSEESRIKMSLCNIGRIQNEETRKKISEAKKGIGKSEETKKKMSDISKKRTYSEETRKKMSEAKKGKPSPKKGIPMSEESKKKKSQSSKGQIPWNKGKKTGQIPWNKGISHNKGKVFSEEYKQKLKDAWVIRRQNKENLLNK